MLADMFDFENSLIEYMLGYVPYRLVACGVKKVIKFATLSVS